MKPITLEILNKEGSVLASTSGTSISLVYPSLYEEGDKLALTCEEESAYLMIQLDDAINESFVFCKKGIFLFPVPFNEKKACYSPKSFSGDIHLLKARYATPAEINTYKNLAHNTYDTHDSTICFPHASANIETRGESIFAAKNAINGNTANHSHGPWPYESWGINRDPEALIKIDFGRSICTDCIVLITRSDFPHDSYWVKGTLNFSDGSTLEVKLEKTDLPQIFHFPKKVIEWVELTQLIKADDESPFPALSQFEVYGTEIESCNA